MAVLVTWSRVGRQEVHAAPASARPHAPRTHMRVQADGEGVTVPENECAVVTASRCCKQGAQQLKCAFFSLQRVHASAAGRKAEKSCWVNNR